MINEIEQVAHAVAFRRGPSAARQQGVPRSPCPTCAHMLPLNVPDVNHIQGGRIANVGPKESEKTACETSN